MMVSSHIKTEKPVQNLDVQPQYVNVLFTFFYVSSVSHIHTTYVRMYNVNLLVVNINQCPHGSHVYVVIVMLFGQPFFLSNVNLMVSNDTADYELKRCATKSVIWDILKRTVWFVAFVPCTSLHTVFLPCMTCTCKGNHRVDGVFRCFYVTFTCLDGFSTCFTHCSLRLRVLANVHSITKCETHLYVY